MLPLLKKLLLASSLLVGAGLSSTVLANSSVNVVFSPLISPTRQFVIFNLENRETFDVLCTFAEVRVRYFDLVSDQEIGTESIRITNALVPAGKKLRPAPESGQDVTDEIRRLGGSYENASIKSFESGSNRVDCKKALGADPIPTPTPTPVVTPTPPPINPIDIPRAMSGFIGQNFAISKGILKDAQEIRICLETEKSISDGALQFEVALAISDWLYQTGKAGEAEFNRYKIVPTVNCDTSDLSFSAHIIIVDNQKLTPNENISSQFTWPHLKCNISTGCVHTLGSITSTWGSGFNYEMRDGRWTSVKLTQPAQAIFSHFVLWKTLSQDIGANTRLSSQEKDEFAAIYEQELQAYLNNQGNAFTRLQRSAERIFGWILARRLNSAGIHNLQAMIDDFYVRKPIAFETGYNAEIGIYPFLVSQLAYLMGISNSAPAIESPLFLSEVDANQAQEAWNSVETFVNRVAP
jgi:hypothetical protein